MAAQSRPNAGAMKAVIYSKVTEKERDELQEAAFEMDRSISWIVRESLIKCGYLPSGR